MGAVFFIISFLSSCYFTFFQSNIDVYQGEDSSYVAEPVPSMAVPVRATHSLGHQSSVRILTEEESLQRIIHHSRTKKSKNVDVSGTREGIDPFPFNPEDSLFAVIPIQSSVSPSGARVYDIPIGTAQGYNFVPKISLQYNSQRGNDVAGYGWTISGLPSISLRNFNLHYDGNAQGVVYDSIDPCYALDGIPIVYTSSTPVPGYNYYTTRGRVLLRPESSSGVSNTWFKVLYPDGQKAEFGYSSATSRPLSFPVTKIQDATGAVINFSYYFDGNRYYIQRITYGDGSAYIDFNYTIASDNVYHRYVFGLDAPFPEKRLQSIVCTDGGSELYRYELTYTDAAETYLLSQIRCKIGGETYLLRPLSFTYGEEQEFDDDVFHQTDSLFMLQYFTQSETEVFRYVRGRFVPGRYDEGLVIFPKRDNYVKIGQATYLLKKYYHYGSGYQSSQVILCNPELDNNNLATSFTAGEGLQTIEAADVDGDGVDEIVKVNSSYSNSQTLFTVTEYSFDSLGIMSVRNTFTFTLAANNNNKKFNNPAQCWYRFGYFLGGAKKMLLVMSQQSTRLALVNLETGTKVFETTCPFSVNSSEQRLILSADFEADGKDDFCHITSSGVDVYTASTVAISLRTTYTGVTSSNLFLDRQALQNGNPMSIPGEAYVIDMNGDGYPDLLGAPGFFQLNNGEFRASAAWNYFFFNGSRFIDGDYRSLKIRKNTDSISFLDVNKDGLPDMIHQQDSVLYCMYNVMGYVSWTSPAFSTSINLPEYADFIPCNLTGNDAAADVLVVKNGTIHKYVYGTDLIKARLLTGMTDCSGIAYENTYSDLSKDEGIYLTDHSRTYDNSNGYLRIRGRLPLLAESFAYMGNSVIQNDYYTYVDAVYNARGLGFCGFGRTRKVDCIRSPNVVYITRSDPERFGLPLRQTERLLFDEDPYYETEFHYATRYNAYMKYYPVMDTLIRRDNLTGIQTETAYTYDTVDYPSSLTTISTLSGSETITDIESISYNHSNSLSLYLLGPIVTHSIIRRNASSQAWKEVDWFSLDSLKRPILKQHFVGDVSSDPGETTYITTTVRWSYDAFGNIVSEESKPFNATTFTGESYAYDSSGRYLVSKADAFGNITTYSGYTLFGKPTTMIDPLGNTTSFSYNVIGDLINTTYPDGRIENRKCVFGGQGLYLISSSSNAGDSLRVHYDALGREILQESLSFDNQWRKVRTEYDSQGRLYRVSLPFVNASPQWDVYSYDSYGRQSSVQEASGRSTSWSYNGPSTITTKEGVSTTSTVDAVGRIVRLADPGGTINYQLRPDGQPVSATVSFSAYYFLPPTTTFSYDRYGRKTGISDPGAGSYTYGYQSNLDGSSVQTKTGPNGTVTTNIDRFGRKTAESRSNSFSTSYLYDSYGRMASESSSNGTGKTFTYDMFGRLSSTTEMLSDGVSFGTSFGYNSIGQLSYEQYSAQGSPLATENYSYANGTLAETKLNGSIPIYRVVSEDDAGHISSALSGSVMRTYVYNAGGYPQSRTMGSVQSAQYVFDGTTGNLTSRQQGPGNTENFLYDGLNRLISSNGSTTVYELEGNIRSIGGVGSMLYNDMENPYLLTSFAPTGGSYSSYPSVNIGYGSFDRPISISNSQYSASLTYNGEHNRVKMNVSDNNGRILTRYYARSKYEKDVLADSTVVERLYLGGDAYSAPMVQVKTGGAWTLYNIGRDYLGSITHLATSDGTLVAEYQYNARGICNSSLLLNRGFTGHEYLPWFGLVNMNARLYDPLVGRFLSPDPLLQDPDCAQGFNRFTYGLNNPLKYTDPDGESIIAAILIGAAVSMAIDYGIQVAFNYVEQHNNHNLTTKDIWLNNIDWFDVGVSGVVGGAFGGLGGAVKAGLNVSKAGMFFLAHPEVLELSEIALTSGIDIIGTKFQKVTGKQFGERLAVGLATFTAMKSISSNISSHIGEQTVKPSLPKNSKRTGSYTVYEGIDPMTGEVKYVGITRRAPEIRWNEHMYSRTERSGLFYRVKMQGLSRMDARILEQTMINQYGLGNLYNKINSISPSYWDKYNIKP